MSYSAYVMLMQSESQFDAAKEWIDNHGATLSNEIKLKVATVGRCSAKRPGLFDFVGKAKWDAWNSLGDMTREAAVAEYVDLVKSIRSEDLDSKASDVSHGEQGGSLMGGVSVSTLRLLQQEEKTNENTSIIDAIKNRDMHIFESMLLKNPECATMRDDQGMTPLHWAVDREQTEMVEKLLATGLVDINSQDEDGQTALILSAYVDNISLAKVLLSHGADPSITDTSGCSVLDCIDTNSTQKQAWIQLINCN